MRQVFPSKGNTTSRSTSESGVAVPQACEPNRMIRSGRNSAAMRSVSAWISAMSTIRELLRAAIVPSPRLCGRSQLRQRRRDHHDLVALAEGKDHRDHKDDRDRRIPPRSRARQRLDPPATSRQPRPRSAARLGRVVAGAPTSCACPTGSLPQLLAHPVPLRYPEGRGAAPGARPRWREQEPWNHSVSFEEEIPGASQLCGQGLWSPSW